MTEHDRWLEDRARDKCFQYPLNKDSLFVDFGMYDGKFANEYHQKFGCQILGFEPLPEFFNKAAAILSHQRIHQVGVGIDNKTISVNNDNDGTSLLKENGSIQVEIRDVIELLKDVEHIDLLKVNIEGFEYDVLDRMAEFGLLERADFILVQFHNFDTVPNVEERYINTRANLSKTHNCQWCYKYVWESWERK